MKFIKVFLIFASVGALPSYAKNLIATPINSPVKETFLKVKLEGFQEYKEVHFKPKNGYSETKGQIIKEGPEWFAKLKVSHLVPGHTYEYRIKINTDSGKSEQEKAASVDFISFSIDPILQVPDPGTEGKKTLLGIDTDKDGIRDDVQRFLLENYYLKPSIRQALLQLSKYYEKLLINSGNPETLKNVAIEGSKALACLAWITEDFDDLSKTLDAVIMNTELRITRRLEAEKNLFGFSRPPEVKRTPWNERNKFCNFSASKE